MHKQRKQHDLLAKFVIGVAEAVLAGLILDGMVHLMG